MPNHHSQFRNTPLRTIACKLRFAESREITDHAGQVCQCFSPSAFATGNDAGTGGMTKSEYKAFLKTLKRRYAEFAFTRFVAVTMTILLIFSLFTFIDELLLYGWSVKSWWSVTKFLFWSAFTVYIYTCPGVSRDTLMKELLAAKRCPSCAFDLAVLPVGGNGLTRCPECNTQWRITPPPPTA